ncbi:MAG TPA: ATP-binding protein [Candidatus Binataceae bacterium]|nr:ATP-binding protein [Candidatus Binataceae bacterium]
MTIRTRMTFWYAGILMLSILLITILSLNEFHEHHRTPISERGMREILEIFLSIAIPAAVLSVAGGWWLMRKSFSPLAELTRAAESITDRNLGGKLPRSGNGDELDRLAEVLNRMTARLNDSFQYIRGFTLHASHELKTPLTVMHGELETALREDGTLTPAQRDRLLSQLDEVQRLSKIVDGLTLLTKADAGQVKLAREPLRLDELVRDAHADTLILGEPRGVKVELAACEELTVLGDRHRLRQLLLNLADNAVKYNQSGGSISMSLSRENGSAKFAMANTGPGIRAEDLPRVFDRFFRGDPAHSNATEGCGLGLSVAQWIASAHHGSIDINSEPARQTVVTVRLPLRPQGKTA